MLGENPIVDARGCSQGDWGRLENVLVRYGAIDSSKKRRLCLVISSEAACQTPWRPSAVAFNFYTDSKTSPATNPLEATSKPVQDGLQLSS
ncbi:uncharacterized protein PGTG_21547 [Puccinia graminis f. sp. tritici CRL 75-36-700-3]|uniref:Uncharacterized protein n=1 Tax=Puccinia graminis f. sp. tritici (strain CRL 75-36-700-3 / race SCCL) TaxID=418459 RepID=H6QRS5_PUCGT|nr:uncharacterized protein PGTG_21547 [Puccinia graminis f. sp. tritici CRL 75-36-700-3]EHS63372.1 hypothetical protein PGTG_21547 [Puccinia graminis f. sp. tritici CRL 75-36-700-3]